MANPHSQGSRIHPYPNSIIERAGVGGFVIECFNKGMSYREICNEVWTKHSVKVSKMCIQRFLMRNRHEYKSTEIGTKLEVVRGNIISNTEEYYKHLTELFLNLNTLIDTSQIKSSEKLVIRKNIEAKQKLLTQEFIEARADIGLAFLSMQQCEDDMRDVLMEFSQSLCPTCRRYVSDVIKEYEKRRKI